MITSPSQAWSRLLEHRNEIAGLRLQELGRDPERVAVLVALHHVSDQRLLMVDLSRQHMTLDTLNLLFQFAAARKLRNFVQQLAWGQNNRNHPPPPPPRSRSHASNKDEGDDKKERRVQLAPIDTDDLHVMPSMHLCLRVPPPPTGTTKYCMYDKNRDNVLPTLHRDVWQRIEHLATAYRKAQLLGVTGSAIRDVVIIGRGTAPAALQFLYDALVLDERASAGQRAGLNETMHRLRRTMNMNGGSSTVLGRRLMFVNTIDPAAILQVMNEVADPASTLVISWALQGDEDTGLATQAFKTWLLSSLSGRPSEQVLVKHMILITGNEHIASVINKPESVFLLPHYARCEAFTSLTAATLLPLAICFGWPIVRDVLAGAHDVDRHFVESKPRHCLPVLLALSDIWNDICGFGRHVTPFYQGLASYASFVATVESQTCGHVRDDDVMEGRSMSSQLRNGGMAGAYDRALFRGDDRMSNELVSVLDAQITAQIARVHGSTAHSGMLSSLQKSRDAQICALFAHADELAFGPPVHAGDTNETRAPMTPTSPFGSKSAEMDLSRGNRPSTIVLCDKLDAFGCGQLIALTEHRATVKAHLFGMDPFVLETGTSLRASRTEQLQAELQQLFVGVTDEKKDDQEDSNSADREAVDTGKMNMSTKTVLGHYANMMRGQR